MQKGKRTGPGRRRERGAKVRGWCLGGQDERMKTTDVIVTSWGHHPIRVVKEQADQQSHTKRQGTLKLKECAPRGPQIESQGRYSDTQSGRLEAAINSKQPGCGR